MADPSAGELWRSGEQLRVQELPFRLLVLLAERSGEVVSREELQSALWPGVEYGEFEHGLNTAVKKVRQALGDSAESPRFIETIPRRGYRFIAPVESRPAESRPAEVAAQPEPRGRVKWPQLGIAGAVVAGVALCGWWFVRPAAGLSLPKLSPPAPLTALAGIETHPNLSPDGRCVAFSWNGQDPSNFDIYVKPVDGEELRRLTSDMGADYGPVWSPDGHRIAFGRAQGNRHAVYVTPVAGGAEVKIAETPELTMTLDWIPIAAWSPDGKWLAISDAGDNEGKSLYLVSPATGERRRVTSQSGRGGGDAAPAFSPDGRWLAYLRFVSVSRTELMVVPLESGYKPSGPPAALEVGRDGTAYSFAWLADSRRMLVAKPWRYGASANRGLWLADARGRLPSVQIEAAPPGTTGVTVLTAGDVAYSTLAQDMNIWRVRLDGEHKAVGEAERLIASTMDDIVPKFSPDGRQIVYTSKRSGSEEVWVCRSDGSGPVQLTKMGYAGSPSWNPDGTRIVFDSMKEGQYEVYTMAASGGEPRRLTNHPGIDGVASYSASGKHIYWMSNRSGMNQVWRMREDGSEAVQVTRDDGYLPRESMDGKWLFYNRERTLRRRAVDSGDDVEVSPSVDGFLNFTLTRDSVYFVSLPGGGADKAIERWDSSSGERQRVVLLRRGVGGTAPREQGLSLSPDGKTLVWAQSDVVSGDLMIMRALR